MLTAMLLCCVAALPRSNAAMLLCSTAAARPRSNAAMPLCITAAALCCFAALLHWLSVRFACCLYAYAPMFGSAIASPAVYTLSLRLPYKPFGLRKRSDC